MNKTTVSIGNSTIFDNKANLNELKNKQQDTTSKKTTLSNENDLRVSKVKSVPIITNGSSYFINGFNKKKKKNSGLYKPLFKFIICFSNVLLMLLFRQSQ